MLQPAPDFFGSYDPRDVNVTFNGVTIDGFAEDMINIAQDDNKIIKRFIGARGDGVAGVNNNFSGSVTLTFLDKAPMMDFLHKQAYMKNFAELTIAYKDQGNRGKQNVIINAPDAYIEELPEFGWRTDPTDRAFMIGFLYRTQNVANV